MQATFNLNDVNAALQMDAAARQGDALPAEVAVHPFQRLGLGRAPFRCTGVTDNGGDLQSMDSGERHGRCQFCTTPIRYEYRIESADGRTFVVGSECVKQTGGAVADFEKFNRQMLARVRELQAKARKERAAAKVADAATAWKAEHAAEFAYMQQRAAKGNGFYAYLLRSVDQYGSIFDSRLASVRNDMQRDNDRAEAQVQYPAKPAPAPAPVVNLEPVEVAFAKAREAGIKWPKLRMGGFVFSPAGANSANPGAVYIKTRTAAGEEAGTYLGKVMNGKLFKSRDCDTSAEAEILEIAKDPKAAAVAYGKKFGRCSVCNRELTDDASVEAGIGPVCASKYGF